MQTHIRERLLVMYEPNGNSITKEPNNSHTINSNATTIVIDNNNTNYISYTAGKSSTAVENDWVGTSSPQHACKLCIIVAGFI